MYPLILQSRYLHKCSLISYSLFADKFREGTGIDGRHRASRRYNRRDDEHQTLRRQLIFFPPPLPIPPTTHQLPPPKATITIQPVQTTKPHPIQAEERASTCSSSRLRMRARASSITSFKAWYQLHPTPLIHPAVGVAAHTPPDGSPSFYSSAASDRTGRSSSGSGISCTPSAACR